MRIGSLCTGYGGLDLAVHDVLGGELAWVADNDPGASAILAHRFPAVPNLGDIAATRWGEVEPVDIVTAGFPCQDISYAGRGAGIVEGNRSGLWYAIADALGAPNDLALGSLACHLDVHRAGVRRDVDDRPPRRPKPGADASRGSRPAASVSRFAQAAH